MGFLIFGADPSPPFRTFPTFSDILCRMTPLGCRFKLNQISFSLPQYCGVRLVRSAHCPSTTAKLWFFFCWCPLYSLCYGIHFQVFLSGDIGYICVSYLKMAAWNNNMVFRWLATNSLIRGQNSMDSNNQDWLEKEERTSLNEVAIDMWQCHFLAQ